MMVGHSGDFVITKILIILLPLYFSQLLANDWKNKDFDKGDLALFRIPGKVVFYSEFKNWHYAVSAYQCQWPNGHLLPFIGHQIDNQKVGLKANYQKLADIKPLIYQMVLFEKLNQFARKQGHGIYQTEVKLQKKCDALVTGPMIRAYIIELVNLELFLQTKSQSNKSNQLELMKNLLGSISKKITHEFLF